VSDIAFADSADGYAFGPGLFATADGGRSWSDQQVANVSSVTIAGNYAYALTGFNETLPQRLYRSPIGRSDWKLVGLPVTTNDGQGLQIVDAGTDLVLLQSGLSNAGINAADVGHLWISPDQGQHWQPQGVPCTVADGGATVLSVALGHPDAWLMLCFDNEQSQQEQDTLQHLYGSANAGRTWVRLADPPQHNAPALLADNGSGHAFLATEGGAGDTLSSTLDGARTWTVAIRDGGSFSGWADLGFVTSSIGFVVGPSPYAPAHLYKTTDGGQTWHELAVLPRPN